MGCSSDMGKKQKGHINLSALYTSIPFIKKIYIFIVKILSDIKSFQISNSNIQKATYFHMEEEVRTIYTLKYKCQFSYVSMRQAKLYFVIIAYYRSECRFQGLRSSSLSYHLFSLSIVYFKTIYVNNIILDMVNFTRGLRVVRGQKPLRAKASDFCIHNLKNKLN